MKGGYQEEESRGYYGALGQSECSLPLQTICDKQRSGKELWDELQNHVVEQKSFQLQDLRDLDQSESGHKYGSRKTNKSSNQAKHIDEMDLPFDFTMSDCAIAFLCYLMVSVLAFSFIFEKWPIVDSLYFAVVTFTTIGYGDIYPDSAAGKLFCVVFAFCGVASLSIGLGVVGATVVEAELNAVTRMEKEFSKEFLKLFRRSSDKAAIPSTSSLTSFGSLTDSSSRSATRETSGPFHRDEKEIDGYTFLKESCFLLCRIFFRYAPAMIPLLLGAGLMAHYEGWKWYDTVYYCVITTTTIGYGDRTPSHELLRLFAVFFIPLAVGAMGHMMGAMANFIMDRRRLVYQQRLLNHELTMHDLETMDEDHDGIVTELEFLVFMLTTLKKVDKETVQMIREQFRRLDLTESGTLGRKDLELMAKKNLRRVRNKLQLSSYKGKDGWKKGLAVDSYHPIVNKNTDD